MATDGRDAVLFLDKNRIFVYDGDNILKVELPAGIIRDLDVIDKTGFDSLIDSFIKIKKITASHLWLVLADSVCFGKDVTQTDPIKIEDEIKDFLEAVPFDQIVSKKYRAQKGIRVIATNLELLEAIGEIFERNEFELEGIVPSAIFLGFNARKTLDLDFAKYIIASKNLIRQGNMLQKVEAPQVTPEAPAPQKKGKLLLVLIAGFSVLLIILVVLVLKK
jgi:hypothetical protein